MRFIRSLPFRILESPILSESCENPLRIGWRQRTDDANLGDSLLHCIPVSCSLTVMNRIPFRASRLFLLLAVLLTTVGRPDSLAMAQDSEAGEGAPSLIRVPKLGTNPLVVVTLASIENAKGKFTALCEIAGTPETAEQIIDGINEATDTLAGVDITQPGGLAVYLNSVFPPRFEFVVFAPVVDTDAFMKTLELGPVISTPVPGSDGRFELLGPTRTSQVRVENGYAFIQLPFMEPDEEFDRQLLDPVTHLSSITGQYDVSVTLDVDSVPRLTRNLLLNFVSSTMSTRMQQRDEEADGLYEMRRAWMQGDIDALKLLLDECRRVSIGMTVRPETRVANIDVLMDVREGSAMLQEILNSTTKPSYFTPILNDDAAVSLSLSQIIPDRDRQRYIGVLEGFKKELARQVLVKKLGPELDEVSPVFRAVTGLQDTFAEGHLDAFGQCFADSNEKLVVIGALRVEDGQQIAVGIREMLERLEGQDGFDRLQIGYGEQAGIEFHRIGFTEIDAGRDAVFGENSGCVFGCGSRSLWFAVGGDETLDTLAAVMDQLQAAYETPTELRRTSGFRVILNVDELIRLGDSADAANSAAAALNEAENEQAEVKVVDPGQDPPRRRRTSGGFGGRRRQRWAETQKANRESWRKSFAEGGDRIRIDYQPTENGARFRIELGEAFIKGIGRGIKIRRNGTGE